MNFPKARAVWLAPLAAAILGTGTVQAEGGPAVVWFRTDDHCPDSAGFLARVEQRGRHARVAKAGDRVDFVVTLSSGAEDSGSPEGHVGSGSSGRLERQTRDGIVAIREVQGDTCAEVADALALSLALAAELPPEGEPAHRNPATVTQPAEQRAVGATPASGTPAIRREGRQPKRASAIRPPVVPGTPHHAMPLWAGAAASLRTSIAPQGAWGGELRLGWGKRHRTPTWRVAILAATGGRGTERGELSVSLIAGMLETCPVQLGGRLLVASWCGGVELGVAHVTSNGIGGTADTGPWAAVTVSERVRWPAESDVALEAGVGLAAPLTPYRVVAANPTATLHQIAPISLAMTLGVSIRLR